MVMAEDDAVQLCLDELRGSEERGAARKMAEERGAALLGPSGVAAGLVAAALDTEDADRAPALALFRALIREAGKDSRRCVGPGSCRSRLGRGRRVGICRDATSRCVVGTITIGPGRSVAFRSGVLGRVWAGAAAGRIYMQTQSVAEYRDSSPSPSA